MKTKLLPTKPTHTVDFFDSFTMKNETAPCRVVQMYLSDDPQKEDMATVEIQQPVRKRIRVPLNCLVEISTGQRLPYPLTKTITTSLSLGETYVRRPKHR